MNQKIDITNNWNIQKVFNELENGNMKIPQYDNTSLGHFKDSWRERIKLGDLYYNRNFDLCKKAFF